jgi:hypothetical protein
MTIEYFVRSVYGVDQMYPASPLMAINHMGLTGRKTLTESDVDTYKKMGFKFKQVLPPNKV